MDDQKEITQLRQRLDELERKQTAKPTAKPATSNSTAQIIYGIVIIAMIFLIVFAFGESNYFQARYHKSILNEVST